MAAPKFVTVPEAVELLDLRTTYRGKRPDRWLIKTLRAKEAALQTRILIADKPGQGARYRVNVATLKTVMVELKDPQELIVSGLHAKLDRLAQLVAKIGDRVDDFESNLGALAQAERERARGIRR